MAKPTKKNQVAPLATPSKWSTNRWYHVIVFLFSFLLYVNSISNDYNLDDELVTRNHRLTSKGISAIPEIFSSPYYQDASGYSYEYRPIVLASFAIEHSLFGESAFVSHFINVLLYALVCLLLFVVLKKLLSTYPAIVPFAITILFAAHTAHTEVVCSIKNRDELLGLGFGLLAIFSSIVAVSQKKKYAYFLIVLFYSAALLSKSTYVGFALIIPLLLLFLTSIHLQSYIVVVFALLTPSYFWVNGISGFNKLLLLLLIFFVSLLGFIIKDHSKFIQWFNSLKHSIGKHFKPIHTNFTNTAVSDFSLKAFLPNRSALNPIFLLCNFSLGALYLWAIRESFSAFALFPLLLLIAIAWFGKTNFSWSAQVSIIFCIVLNFLVSPLDYQDEAWGLNYYNLVSLSLAFFLFWGNQKLAIPIIIGLVIIVFKIKTFSVPELLTNLIFAYLSRFRPLLWLATAINIFNLGNDIYSNHYLQEWYRLFGFITVYGVISKKTNITSWILIVIGLIYFHFLSFSLDKDITQSPKKYISTSYLNIRKIADQSNPKLVKNSENRPIHFVENCISYTDNASIRIGTSFAVLVHYFKKTIFPYPLSFYYGYRIITPKQFFDTTPIIGLLIYTILFFLSLFFVKRLPLLSIGILTYLISITAFSNIITLVPGIVGDRYLLLPSLGWSITVVSVIYGLILMKTGSSFPEVKQISPVYRYSFLILLSLYTVLTIARNNDWRDDLTLFRKDVSYVNESAQAHNLLALHLMQHVEVETNANVQLAMTQEALSHFKKATQIYPPFFNATYDIGRVYIKLNMIDSALGAFKAAVKIDSSYSMVHNYIAEIYFSKQMYKEAVPYYEKVVGLDPLNYDNYNKLSYDYFMLKDYDKSVEVCKKALVAIPSEPQPLINMGRMFLLQNKTDSAIYYLNIAKTKVPNNPELNSLLQQINQ
jgi:hypothetical protein